MQFSREIGHLQALLKESGQTRAAKGRQKTHFSQWQEAAKDDRVQSAALKPELLYAA
jgi:hypothetical protein